MTGWRSGQNQIEVPYSERFEDIYFSTDHPLDEVRTVFLEPNRIAERLSPSSILRVGELGFGTGLNFFLTAIEAERSGSDLSFFSLEKYPIELKAIERAFAQFPNVKESQVFREFREQYELLPPGFHRFHFLNGKIRLTLAIGDVNWALKELSGSIDAWYLDGFAPSRNEEMWSESVLKSVADASREGTTFGTFSAAARVRKRLEALGFEVEKTEGFGKKRERCFGRMRRKHFSEPKRPWFEIALPESVKQKSIHIVGGGMAGCALARSLSQRGFSVRLFEKRPEIASTTSGNPQGVFVPMVGDVRNPLCRLSHAGFGFFVRENRAFENVNFCGAIRLGLGEFKDRYQKALEQVPKSWMSWLDAKEVSERLGTRALDGGVWIPKAGWAVPNLVVNKWLEQSGAEVFCDVAQEGKPEAGTLTIYAPGYEASEHELFNKYPIRSLRGQVATLRGSHSLNCVVAYEGYLTPGNSDGVQLIGASFDRHRIDLELRPEETDKMIDQAHARFPKWKSGQVDRERVGVRAVTPDSLPLVGPMADFDSFCSDYSELWKGKQKDFPMARASEHWVLTALGSKGLVNGAIGAEIIASALCEDILPVEKSLLEAIHPQRFWVRDLKRHPNHNPG